MPAVERSVTLECAGNGRLDMRPLPIGEPWGDYAVSTARWTGALLSDVLERARPADNGVDVRFEGADSGPYHLHPILADTNKDDLTFVRSLPLALATDPAAEILIAYEMNGEPLRPDHGAPFRIIVPHWFAVASVKWLHRIDVLTEPYVGEFQTGHYIYEWPDRPHEPVTLMRVRARITDPAPGAVLPLGTHTVRGKAWSGSRPDHTASTSASPAKANGTRRRSSHPKGPYQWQDWTFDWTPASRRQAHPPGPRNRRRRQRPTRGPTVEPARLRQQRHRSPLRRHPLTSPGCGAHRWTSSEHCGPLAFIEAGTSRSSTPGSARHPLTSLAVDELTPAGCLFDHDGRVRVSRQIHASPVTPGVRRHRRSPRRHSVRDCSAASGMRRCAAQMSR